MTIDRTRIEELLAGAVTPQVTAVDLPKLGEKVFLRSELPQSALVRIGVFASSGDDDDRDASAIIATLRFALVDEDGKTLLHSFAEAQRFVDVLAIEDLDVIARAVAEYSGPGAVEDVDSGKVPSVPAPSS